jgi:hypothetical protein
LAVEFVVDVDAVELDEVVVEAELELEVVDVAEALVELVELLAELVLVELAELVAVEVDEDDEEYEEDDDEEDKKTDVEVLELETEVVLFVELDDEVDELPVCATESVTAIPLWKWTYSRWSDWS